MDKIFFDTAIFFGGHALILGHKPNKITMSQINNKLEEHPQDIKQFGLFDNSTPNYTTYYPDVTAEDLHPSESEFIEPVFRMLSNITVNVRHNPIYFSSEVLKKSMYKMIGQTINIDHEMAVGNAIGSVKAVEWQNAYTTNGVKIPAGFNAVMLIDGKSNPRIARGIMMEPPSIHSNSVTVTFTWKKSHEKMPDDEFFQKLGSFDDKGKLIQRIVVEVVGYHETSLVSHGADPFAQKIGKDGKINNPKYAGDRYLLSDQNIDGEQLSPECFSWDWKQFNDDYHGEITTGTITTIPNAIINNNDNQNFEDMNEMLRFLEILFGLDKDSLTEENYQEKAGVIGTELTQLRIDVKKDPDPIKVLELEGVEAIKAEITTLRAKVKDLPEDWAAQVALSGQAKIITDELRADTDRLYKLSIEEGKEDASILAIIAGADHKTLKALHKQYDNLTEGKFAFTCTACGSHDVTRASADPTKKEEFTEKETSDVIDNLTSSGKVDTRFIEGPKEDK